MPAQERVGRERGEPKKGKINVRRGKTSRPPETKSHNPGKKKKKKHQHQIKEDRAPEGEKKITTNQRK